MEVLLDSSFVVSCMLARVDFLDVLAEKGFKVVVPKEVVDELKDLKEKKGQSHEVKIAIDAALMMFEQKKVKKMSIGKGLVDNQLIKLGKEGIHIATLDNVIRRSVPNRVILLSAKKSIVVERE